jgi:hypothetical protein
MGPDRDYLADLRRMIIARAIVGSLAAALPVPFLDDGALTVVLGGGYRRIAAAHGISLSRGAQLALVHGPAEPPSLAEIAGGEIAFRVAGRAAVRAMTAFAALGRVQSASRTFVTMTLFTHYCARLHSGPALDAATATALRSEIDRAIDQVPGGLELRPRRRAGSPVPGASLFLDRAIDVLDRGWRVRLAAGIRASAG